MVLCNYSPHIIIPTDHIKYQGASLDSTLSDKYHCEILSNKLKRANGMLSMIRHYVPKEDLKSIYLFSSHMVYGCQIWGQNRSSHVEKICKLQNRAMRIINFEDFHANTNPLYINNNILKLQDLIRLQNSLFAHDYLDNSLPACLKTIISNINIFTLMYKLQIQIYVVFFHLAKIQQNMVSTRSLKNQ